MSSGDAIDVVIITGTANPKLALDVATALGVKAYQVCSTFADGETFVQIPENIRGKDVYILQPTSCPADVMYMQVFFMQNACQLSSAGKVTVVMPYYGYARQDRKTMSRTPISASVVAKLLCKGNPNRVVTVDLHSGQIQGFFPNVPVDNLYASGLFAQWVRDNVTDLANVSLVSPDAGGVQRVKLLAEILPEFSGDIVTIVKQRSGPGKIESMDVHGIVKGRHCIMVDDIIDTAGTICCAAKALHEEGAVRITVMATHGVFSGPAYERIANSSINQVVYTDTIRKDPACMLKEVAPKLERISVAPLLAQAIRRLHNSQSLSELFTTVPV